MKCRKDHRDTYNKLFCLSAIYRYSVRGVLEGEKDQVPWPNSPTERSQCRGRNAKQGGCVLLEAYPVGPRATSKRKEGEGPTWKLRFGVFKERRGRQALELQHVEEIRGKISADSRLGNS